MESAGIGYDFMLPSNNAVRPKGSAGQGLYNFYTQLLNKARSGSVVNHYVRTNPKVVKMHVENNMLVGQATIEYGVLNGKYEIKKDVLPEGVTITGYTGENGDVLTISAPLNLMGESINISDVFVGYDNRCAANIYWLDDSGGKQAVAVPVVDRMVQVATGNLSFKSDASTITIIKHGKTDDVVLANAVFGIYSKSDDSLIEQLTTGSNGKAVSGSLMIGDYYIKELTPPEGYTLNKGAPSLSITAAGQNKRIHIYNQRIKGKVQILKTGEVNNTLSGAIFGVYDTANNLIQELITDEKGVAVSEYLFCGNYYLKELSAPEGYVISNEAISFSINENEEIIKLTALNTLLRGNIQITKEDEEGNFLQGAVFGVYDSEYNLIEQLVTDLDGIAISSDFIYGDYYLKELTAPIGYVADSSVYSFSIIEDGQTLFFNVTNEKILGYVEVVKKDSETGESLEGVEFGIYNLSDELIEIITTDNYGYAISSELEYGDYYLKEAKPHEGYILNEDMFSFLIQNDNETIHFDITNDPIKGKVEIVKTDEETGAVLQGAVFGIYDDNDNFVQKLITDENGYTISDFLLYWDYYIKELEAPEDYLLGEHIHQLSISESNQIVSFDITNRIIKGRVEVIKTEPIKGKPLEGVVFGVYDSADNLIEEIITDTDGIALSPDLDYGNYYLKEHSCADVYILEDNKYQFSIMEDDEVIQLDVLNVPVVGSLEVFFKHIDYGNELNNSYVYTDWVGMSYMDWINSQGLVEKELLGYSYVKADYPDSNEIIDGKLIITYWYEDEQENGGWSQVAIPKTGQEYPILNYFIGILCFILAILIAGVSYMKSKKGKQS